MRARRCGAGQTGALDRINGVLLPLYIFGMIACIIWAVAREGYSNNWLNRHPAGDVDIGVPGWWFAFTVYMGVWVVVMMTWDVARFGRKEDTGIQREFHLRHSVLRHYLARQWRDRHLHRQYHSDRGPALGNFGHYWYRRANGAVRG